MLSSKFISSFILKFFLNGHRRTARSRAAQKILSLEAVDGMNLLYETLGLKQVAHEALQVADLALQVRALVAEFRVALAKRLLLGEQHLNLGLLLLAVARRCVLVLLLLARAAVVDGARVRLGARGGGPLLVGGRARGRRRRGAGRGAIPRRLWGREFGGAVADELLDGLQVAVVERGDGGLSRWD